MVEYEFFVNVCGNVLPVKFCVELGGDRGNGFRFAEHKCKGYILILLLCAFLWEGFGAQNLRVGVGLVPGPKEDVVLGGL